MGRKRKYIRKRRQKRGQGLPYVYNNRIYLAKRPQTGLGAISKILATLLANVGNVIGI